MLGVGLVKKFLSANLSLRHNLLLIVQVLFYCCSWCFRFCLFVVVVVVVVMVVFVACFIFYLVTSLIIIPCGKFGCLTWLKEKSKVFQYAK